MHILGTVAMDTVNAACDLQARKLIYMMEGARSHTQKEPLLPSLWSLVWFLNFTMLIMLVSITSERFP